MSEKFLVFVILVAKDHKNVRFFVAFTLIGAQFSLVPTTAIPKELVAFCSIPFGSGLKVMVIVFD